MSLAQPTSEPRHHHARWWVGALGALLLVAASWDVQPVAVAPGLDPGWQAGLHMLRGSVFGRDISFTYGPLGFLAFPRLVSTGGYVASLVATGLLRLAYAGMLLRVATRSARWIGVPIAYAVARLTAGVDMPTLVDLTVVMCVATLVHERRDRLSARHGMLIGLSVAILAQMKFNTAALAAGVAACVLVAIGRRGARIAAAVAAPVGFAGGWLLTGNPIGSIPGYAKAGLEFSRGYTAMAFERPNYQWEYAAFATILGGMALAALASLPRLGLRRGLACTIAASGSVFMLWKHGFIRHDPHSYATFIGVGLLALVFAGGRRWRTVWLTCLFAAVGSAAALAKAPVVRQMDPRPSLRTFAGQAHLTVAGGPEHIDRNRGQLRRYYNLDARTVHLLSGHTVHFEPWEMSLAFAYPEFEWAPLPIPQSYSAFTTWLDERNARSLSGPDGPQYILRQNVAIDSRYALWESPQANVELACRYREVHRTGAWQVLERTSSRCGDWTLESVVHTGYGEPIRIPERPGSLVTFRVRGLASARDRLLDALHKAPTTFALWDPVRIRFLPGTADAMHIVAAPDDLVRGFFVPRSDQLILRRHCPDCLPAELSRYGGARKEPAHRFVVEFWSSPICPPGACEAIPTPSTEETSAGPAAATPAATSDRP